MSIAKSRSDFNQNINGSQQLSVNNFIKTSELKSEMTTTKILLRFI